VHDDKSSQNFHYAPVLLTRQDLAKRWSVSVRTIDRLRQDGILPWIDLNNGHGAKPLVRFPLKDIEDHEQKARLGVM